MGAYEAWYLLGSIAQEMMSSKSRSASKLAQMQAEETVLHTQGSPLLALDFDGTLAVRDVMPWDLAHAFGPPERVAELEAWLRKLRELGVTLIIVSRNTRKVVTHCITNAGWIGLFAHVFGREDVESYSAWHGRKSVLIRRILLERYRMQAEDLLFIDDDPAHCSDVCKRVPGAAILHVRGKRGLEEADLCKAMVWACERLSLTKLGTGLKHGHASATADDLNLLAHTLTPTPVMRSKTMQANALSRAPTCERTDWL